MSEKKKVFTLTLSRWLRGRGSNDSYLYSERSQKLCCLGMFGEQCGVPLGEMLSIGSPQSVPQTAIRGDFALLLKDGPHHDGDSELAELAMAINDNKNTTDGEKIRALRSLFGKIGYELVVAP